jgi:hypothetical protein
MTDDKVFASGFIFKRNEKAPDFVVGSISMKVDDAITFMRDHEKNGWVNLTVKQARSGNYYIELDTFEPKKGGASSYRKERDEEPVAREPQVEEESDELPF